MIPSLDWREIPTGFFYTKARRLNDYIWISTNDVILPNFTQAGCVFESTNGKEPKYFGRNSFTRWVVPIDDENTTVLAFRHFNPRAETARDEWRTPEALERIDIAELRNRPYEERQRNPGDYEAFVGQGRISPHKREKLASSDRGVVLYRRRLRQEIRKLQSGQAPARPAGHRQEPIPTYGSDTVIRFPVNGSDSDVEEVLALQKQVGDIYQEADPIKGEARYEFLAERLALLNKS